MIVIIDYGIGNLHSVSKAFEKLGFETKSAKIRIWLKSSCSYPSWGRIFGEAVEQMEK